MSDIPTKNLGEAVEKHELGGLRSFILVTKGITFFHGVSTEDSFALIMAAFENLVEDAEDHRTKDVLIRSGRKAIDFIENNYKK